MVLLRNPHERAPLHFTRLAFLRVERRKAHRPAFDSGLCHLFNLDVVFERTPFHVFCAHSLAGFPIVHVRRLESVRHETSALPYPLISRLLEFYPAKRGGGL